jgi:excinuclease ABC subunit B
VGRFKIVSDYKPKGDQPKAIEGLVESLSSKDKYRTLLGVTGSGKTFTVANVIEKVQRPTLVIAHNKTLAAQLCSEFKEFFPENAVEFFVSYYDYYQPEAYLAHSDTYIEKDANINDEIDKLRHSATAALFERRDVIIVASVSCIYGLGDPIDYNKMVLSVRPGMVMSRREIVRRLVDIQYDRNDISFERNTFRVRGDTIEVFPASSNEKAIRIELFGDEIDRITEVSALTGQVLGVRSHAAIFPASHHVTSREKIEKAIVKIEKELKERHDYFISKEQFVEAQRIRQRTMYDMEMLREIGFCNGIENYSRHLSGREEGERPYTLMDYFPEDMLVVVDESHVSLPQIRAMYAGDRSRKQNLVDYGFRLPSALDNRPLNFGEFETLAKQIVCVSATPSPYEREKSESIVEQIIRPTGLLDPKIIIRPVDGQIDNLISEINKRVKKKQRTLVTTLTKKMAEKLTQYLAETGIKVRYMHSGIDTLERIEIIRELRIGSFDVLVGINLLREGLDLPEVTLVAILDADKEGFLRSETALVQTIGRASRNVEGSVIMYADRITRSMDLAIKETDRRRKTQAEYNKKHGITPSTIKKNVRELIGATKVADAEAVFDMEAKINRDELVSMIKNLKKEMKSAAKALEFERAAEIRDRVTELEKKL